MPRNAWVLMLSLVACEGPPQNGAVGIARASGAPDSGMMSSDAGALAVNTAADGGPMMQAAPVLRSVSPSSGVPGSVVELAIDQLVGIPTVSFGVLAALDVQVVRPGMVRCLAPAGEGLMDVIVRAGSGESLLRRAFRLEPGSMATADAGAPTDGGSMNPADAGSSMALDAGTSARQSAFTLQAEAATSMQGVQVVGDAVGFVDDGDWLAFDGVAFGTGVDQVEVRLATPNAGGQLEFRLDDANGPLVGSLSVTSTGAWTDRRTQRASLTRTTGTRRLVVVARGRADVANLDAFTFNP